MKIARIIARAPIIGCKNDFDLEALNGIFKSPYHEFKEDKSHMQIFDYLENLYMVEVNKLYNPELTLEYKDKSDLFLEAFVKEDK